MTQMAQKREATFPGRPTLGVSSYEPRPRLRARGAASCCRIATKLLTCAALQRRKTLVSLLSLSQAGGGFRGGRDSPVRHRVAGRPVPGSLVCARRARRAVLAARRAVLAARRARCAVLAARRARRAVLAARRARRAARRSRPRALALARELVLVRCGAGRRG